MRLQKFIAQAGIASRRHAEDLIVQGNVSVNNKIITILGVKIDPKKDQIYVNGKLIFLPQKKIYLAFHKPTGVVCSATKISGKKIVVDLIKLPQRFFTVGRLDEDTSGLLLLTDDGEFANQIMHPRYGCDKEYEIEIADPLSEIARQKLERGIILDDRRTNPAQVKIISSLIFRLTITEGRYHQVRRMCSKVGLEIITLKRVRIKNLRLGNLKIGQFRELTEDELQRLRSRS